MGSESEAVIAALDIGTNSFHLVVAKPVETGFEVITSEKEVIRLGHGAGDMKQLEPEAIERGIASLKRMRAVADVHGAKLRAVATSAVREAKNRNEFIKRARKEADIEVEVISGVEEARLIHLGARYAVAVGEQPMLLCDIGGGSTELVVAAGDEILLARSFKLGAVRLTDRFFSTDALHPSALSSCRKFVRSMLATIKPEVLELGFEIAVGSSGSVEAVAKLIRKLNNEPEPKSLVHHPHESFASSVESFVAQAASDPKVHSIKMTLYRTSGDSAIAKHLVRAAESGKQVAVVLEIKARFDEARNIAWAKELEFAGVHVTYGIVGLKTHSKCILVVREDSDQMRRYVHIGTGNYNSVTARVYEDIGFFTCEEQIGSDATELFNYLTGYAKEPDYLRLFVAPHQLRPRILELIHREASFKDKGQITLKLNSISDPSIIDALYAASNAGVKIDLIVRGICCLRAGVPGMSENIRVRSILGRYLEHSRIYRFEHGLEDESPLHLIGSADLMGRNLDGRVEVLVPLTHPKHRAWLDKVLSFLNAEDVVHFKLGSDDKWVEHNSGAEFGDAQQRLHEWVVATQVR